MYNSLGTVERMNSANGTEGSQKALNGHASSSRAPEEGLAMPPSKPSTSSGKADLGSSLRSIKKKVEEAAADAKLRRERDDDKARELNFTLNAKLNCAPQVIPRLNPSIKSKAAERRDVISRGSSKNSGAGRPRVRSANANLASKKTVGEVMGGREYA